uniref:Putative secreted protein n=1 Tax=Panstrongylus lignarius TaxID=156445 RepID=A0A224XUK8_9HEMI
MLLHQPLLISLLELVPLVLAGYKVVVVCSESLERNSKAPLLALAPVPQFPVRFEAVATVTVLLLLQFAM